METGSAFAVAAKKIVDSVVGGYVSEMGQVAKVIKHRLSNSFEEYCVRIHARNEVFHSVVFKNGQRRLRDYYVPLTLMCESGTATRVDKYPAEFVTLNQRVVIVDTAGMGKSTLLKFMSIDMLEKEIGIPIFFELRRLKDVEGKSFLDVITSEFASLQDETDVGLLHDLLREGDFVFFLDGFDELPDAMKPRVVEMVHEFIARAPRNRFVISSRDEPMVKSFTGFHRVQIRPLELVESEELIRKYAKGDNRGSELVELLKAPEHASAHEFLPNPLLVSLLYRAYEHKSKIPLRKHIFYEQVFNSLFEEHDLEKPGRPFDREKRTRLSLDRFHKVMRAVGYLTHFREGKLQYELGQIRKIFCDARDLSGEPGFEANDLLIDLEQKVPLMVRDGLDIRWSHKSIQEYFAADFLFKDLPENSKTWEGILSGRIPTTSHLLELYKNIDPGGFKRRLLLPLLNEILADCELKWSRLHQGVLTRDEFDDIYGVAAFNSRLFVCSAKYDIGYRALSEHDDFQKLQLFSEEIDNVLKESGFPWEAKSFTLVNPTLIESGASTAEERVRNQIISQCDGLLSLGTNVVETAKAAAALGRLGSLPRRSMVFDVADDTTFANREKFELVMAIAGQIGSPRFDVRKMRAERDSILAEQDRQTRLLEI